MSRRKKLQINYDDFLSIIREWDNYLSVKVRVVPKGFSEGGIEGFENYRSSVRYGVPELADLLWNSLQNGREGLENEHSEMFVEYQIDFFENDCFYLDPREVFAKLGKAAQIRLIQSGSFEKAVSEYEAQTREYREQKIEGDRHESAKNEKRREELRIHKKVREIDKMQCVFCGNLIEKTTDCRYRRSSINGYIAENVFLSCNKCIGKELEPKFGRFVNQ